jgi:plasmid stabilization system protein ParE
MPYPIRYSTRSNKEYEEIHHYVFNAFGAVVAAKVDAYFDKVIDQIAINPNLSCIIHKLCVSFVS